MSIRVPTGLFILIAGCGADPELARHAAGLTGHVAKTLRVDRSCPPPTVGNPNGHCILPHDVVIDAPLELDSYTVLDCKGHRILPSAVAVDGPPGIFRPSVPEVAVALLGTRQATVQNCVIGAPDRRTDFGVVILSAKSRDGLGGNQVLDNELQVHGKGILMLNADDTLVSGNLIEWDGGGGGVHVHHDADRNRITHNVLNGSDRPANYVRDMPGTETLGNSFDVAVFHAGALLGSLYNIVVGGHLIQIDNSDGERLEDNLVEDNVATLPGPHTGKNHGGIVVAVMSSRSTIRGNTVIGGRPGIRHAGFTVVNTLHVPARCSGDDHRLCLTDDDCNLPGFDAVGTCPALGPDKNIDGRAMNPLDEGNTLIGPFGDPGGTNTLDCAIGPFGSTLGAVVRDNRVSAAGSSFGVVVSGEGMRDSVTGAANSGALITRNTVDGARVALNLRQPPAPVVFGARIWQNDFTNSVTQAVAATGAYAIATELSVDDQGRVCGVGSTGCVGNYWGHPAAPGFDATDTNNAAIHDLHPFCQPVAAATGALPATCP
jgi:hypothetical protein